VLIVAVVVLYLGTALWASLALSRDQAQGNVLSWRASPQSVDVVMEVRGPIKGAIDCVVKATDLGAADVGYRTVTVPSSPSTVEISLPTVIRAASVNVLGCGPSGEPVRVAGPDFPPGIAIP